MEQFKLTEEHIKNARSYVPIAEKILFIEYCADRCFDRLNISTEETAGTDHPDMDIPPLYKENISSKSKYLMAALIKLYLGIDYTLANAEKDKWQMDNLDYDEYAGAHVLNQIERMKSHADVRDKCFDILQDYKDLEKRFNTEVYGLLNAMNEPCTRIISMIQMRITPESMQKALDEMNNVRDDIEQYKQQKKKGD